MKHRKILLRALKIAVGSSLAIYIAGLLGLEYETAAGSITLLTLVTTKWETIRLSWARVFTFYFAVLLGAALFTQIDNEWMVYGIYIFLLVYISTILDWGATVSVNAVIGTHFLTSMDFSLPFIINEFLLVLIGISVAILLNLFHGNYSHKQDIIQKMRITESDLQRILRELAAYLSNKPMGKTVWDDIIDLEERLKGYVQDAHEYQNNTFHSHPEYYIDYFEMRMQQCGVLHNLHYEMRKIRSMPVQAKIVADYIMYMIEYIIEKNEPKQQMEELNRIFEKMAEEPLPVSREEFESRAILYHILMDLEDFLIFKKRFVEGLNERQIKEYWK